MTVLADMSTAPIGLAENEPLRVTTHAPFHAAVHHARGEIPREHITGTSAEGAILAVPNRHGRFERAGTGPL